MTSALKEEAEALRSQAIRYLLKAENFSLRTIKEKESGSLKNGLATDSLLAILPEAFKQDKPIKIYEYERNVKNPASPYLSWEDVEKGVIPWGKLLVSIVQIGEDDPDNNFVVGMLVRRSDLREHKLGQDPIFVGLREFVEKMQDFRKLSGIKDYFCANEINTMASGDLKKPSVFEALRLRRLRRSKGFQPDAPRQKTISRIVGLSSRLEN